MDQDVGRGHLSPWEDSAKKGFHGFSTLYTIIPSFYRSVTHLLISHHFIRKQLYTQMLCDHTTYSDGDRAFLSIGSNTNIRHYSAPWHHLGKDLSLNEDEFLLLAHDFINLQAPNIPPPWLFSPDTKTKKKQGEALSSLDRWVPGASNAAAMAACPSQPTLTTSAMPSN